MCETHALSRSSTRSGSILPMMKSKSGGKCFNRAASYRPCQYAKRDTSHRPRKPFDRYLADGAAAHVPRELPEPAEAIAVIRAAGGVAVLAHPSWLDRSEGIYKICERLKAVGLAGIEVHYSSHRPEQTMTYLDVARRLDLLVTGGSDFHGVTKPDIEVGIGKGQLKVPEALLEPLRKAATA